MDKPAGPQPGTCAGRSAAHGGDLARLPKRMRHEKSPHLIGHDMGVLLGRALALGLHPFAAWRARPSSRVPLVVGYFVSGYVVALAALFAF
jgi:hypothetical protein